MCSIWGACSLLHLWSIDKHVKSANNTLLPGRTGIRSPSKTALPRYSNRLPRPSRDSSSFDSTCLTACLNHSSLFPPPSPPSPSFYQIIINVSLLLSFRNNFRSSIIPWIVCTTLIDLYYSEIIGGERKRKKKDKEMREREKVCVWERCFVTIARIPFQGLSLPILTG